MTVRETLDGVLAAWKTGDALRASAYFADEASFREAGHAPITGRTAIVNHFTRFFRDGPAWRFDVDAVLVDGDAAAVQYRFALEGANGTWRERAGCAFVRLAHGRIAEWREYEG